MSNQTMNTNQTVTGACSAKRGFIRRDGKPQVGQTMIVRSHVCKITKVLPLGTVEVLDGDKAYRVSGLNFI